MPPSGYSASNPALIATPSRLPTSPSFFEQARADDVHTLARDGMPEALDGMHRRLQERVPEPEVAKTFIIDDDWSNLPTPLYADNVANTEFQQSPHANRV